MNADPEVRTTTRWPWWLRVFRNPLARGVDRTETVLLIGLMAIWLVSVPLLATVASATWPTVESRVLAEQSRVVAVDAVLQSDAASVSMDPRSPSMVQPTAAASWPGRDGRLAQGTITVGSTARAGDHLTIWLDADGTVVDRPMTTHTAAGLLAAGTAGAWLVLGLTIAGVGRAVRWRFDRRRSRSWAQEWASFGAGRPSGTGEAG